MGGQHQKSSAAIFWTSLVPKGHRARRLRCGRAGNTVKGGQGNVSFNIGVGGIFPSS